VIFFIPKIKYPNLKITGEFTLCCKKALQIFTHIYLKDFTQVNILFIGRWAYKWRVHKWDGLKALPSLRYILVELKPVASKNINVFTCTFYSKATVVDSQSIVRATGDGDLKGEKRYWCILVHAVEGLWLETLFFISIYLTASGNLLF